MQSTEAKALRKIIGLVRRNTGHDFSLYKQKTIWRRILRRMSVFQFDDMESYSNYIEANPGEAKSLFNGLLIGVTNFFRDPEAFESLKYRVIMPLIAKKPDHYSFRVWVPGCSTGEEVYSLAIIFKECMEETGRQFPVRLFGTDIDSTAIGVASSGVYPLTIASDIRPDRLKAFFARLDSAYCIRDDIRQMTLFALQNLASAPPLIDMDLVSCRNVLIYLEPKLQRKVISNLHRAIKPGGFLNLGYSETPGVGGEFFTIVDKKWKLFKRSEMKVLTAGLETYPVPKTGRPELCLSALETRPAETPISTRTNVTADLNWPALPHAINDEDSGAINIRKKTRK